MVLAALCLLSSYVIYGGLELWYKGTPFHFRSMLQELPDFFSVYYHGALMILVAMGGAHHVVLLQRDAQQREREASRLRELFVESREMALRMQIQPHFLFNTLNSISTLVHTDAMAADRMIAKLGRFFRLTLDQAPGATQSLKSEMEFIDAYLAIERIRFKDRLQVDVDLAPECLELPVPSFLLQPLVENALKHGLSDRKSGGTLRLKARIEGDHWNLEVSDDGLGANAIREGTGLSNVRSRLKLAFHDDFHLEIQTRPNVGTTVRIELPLGMEM